MGSRRSVLLDHHDLTAFHQAGGDLRAWLAYHLAAAGRGVAAARAR